MSGAAPATTATALALAIYALHDTLVEKGVLAEGEVANTLRRFRHDDPELMATVAAIAASLDERPFKVLPRNGLQVIKSDTD